MNWIVLSIISAVCGSLTRILQKSVLKDERADTYAFGFVFQLFVAGLFILYTLITGTLELPNLSNLFLNLLLMTVCYSLGTVCTFYAFKRAEASEVSIIFTSSTIWSVISAVLLLGEQLKVIHIAGIVCIVFGIIALQYTGSKWKMNAGHVLAALGALLFGIGFTNDAFIIQKYHSIASYMILAYALPGIFTILYKPKSIRLVPHFFSRKIFIKMAVCAIVYALGGITIFTAYKNGGQASIISPLSQTSILFTILFGYVFLNERTHMPNKIIGMTLSFIGVLLLIK